MQAMLQVNVTAKRWCKVINKIVTVLVAIFITGSCLAAYPERPIRIIAPVAPGGSVDTVARIITPKMPALLGQNVVIDNRGGANYIIGTEIVARAPADGYTLLVTAGAHTINPAVYKKLPYDALRDFTPVVHIVNSGGLVIAVHPSFPAQHAESTGKPRKTSKLRSLRWKGSKKSASP